MMVGATMTGKSKIIEVLKNSYTSLRLNKNDNKYNEIESAALNPKSISMQELYGDYDAIT
jgi:dynein heavy chain